MVMLSLICAALAFTFNSVFLLFKPRSKQLSALLILICSKWQPLYFSILSTERLVFNALIIHGLSKSEHVGACSILTFEAQNQIFAAAFLWNLVIFLSGLSILCCDLDEDFTPFLRRCSYAFFCIFSLLDAFGSYAWGNTLATRVRVSVGSFKFVLDNQITSCISSQVLISLQLLSVSYRSHHGLAWAYPPIIFELHASEAPSQITPTLSTPLLGHALSNQAPAVEPLSVMVAASASDSVSNDSCPSALMRMHQHWLLFQLRQRSLSAVFAIPCRKNQDLGCLEVVRPLVALGFLKPLHRLSEARPRLYICCTVSLMLASFGLSFASQYGEVVSIFVAFLSWWAFFFLLGFFSSRYHSFDRIAAKHVASSFRFAFCVLLCLVWISLYFRAAYIGQFSFSIFAGIVPIVPFFLLCLLGDCSPQLSVFVQLCISVRTSFMFSCVYFLF